MTDLTRLTALQQAGLLRSGEVSSRELAATHLDAAQRQNHALNAWLVIDRRGALEQADAADALHADGARDAAHAPGREQRRAAHAANSAQRR